MRVAGGHPARHQRIARPQRMLTALVLLIPLLLLSIPTAGAQIPTPEQVHVTLGQTPGTLVIQWAVGAEYLPAEEPTVVWSAEGTSENIAPAEMAGEITPSSADPPGSTYVYSAEIGPVAPGAPVTYRVGSAARGYAGPYEVRAPPSVNDTLRFVAYADIGIDDTLPDGNAAPTGSAAHDVRDAALRTMPDLLIIPGDLAYSNSRRGWDSFMRFMEPIQATTPTMPTPGNHEHYDGYRPYDRFLEEYVLPNNEQDYLFRAGPVTFVALNSDSVCGPGHTTTTWNRAMPCLYGPTNNVQIAWLEDALAQAAEDETPWTVVYLHHPLYSWGDHGSYGLLQHLWEPLFEAYGVDLVIAGHDHLYSRSYPIVNGTAAADGDSYVRGAGIVHVVTGGGGRALYDMPETEPPEWHAYGEEAHHFVQVDASPGFLSVKAIRPDGSEMDSFTISIATGPPVPSPAEDSAGAASLATAAALLAGTGFLRTRRQAP